MRRWHSPVRHRPWWPPSTATCSRPTRVSGGAKAESRGILATRREIKESKERIAGERQALTAAVEELTSIELVIAETTAAIAALGDEQHRLALTIVGHEGQLARADEDVVRLARKASVIALERVRRRKSSLRSPRGGPKPKPRSDGRKRRSARVRSCSAMHSVVLPTHVRRSRCSADVPPKLVPLMPRSSNVRRPLSVKWRGSRRRREISSSG
jgi:hypothetical protein